MPDSPRTLCCRSAEIGVCCAETHLGVAQAFLPVLELSAHAPNQHRQECLCHCNVQTPRAETLNSRGQGTDVSRSMARTLVSAVSTLMSRLFVCTTETVDGKGVE